MKNFFLTLFLVHSAASMLHSQSECWTFGSTFKVSIRNNLTNVDSVILSDTIRDNTIDIGIVNLGTTSTPLSLTLQIENKCNSTLGIQGKTSWGGSFVSFPNYLEKGKKQDLTVIISRYKIALKEFFMTLYVAPSGSNGYQTPKEIKYKIKYEVK